MFGMGMPEILLILAIALIVIGPKKLPDLAKSLGRALGEFKKATTDLKESMQIDHELADVKNAFDQMNTATEEKVEKVEPATDDDMAASDIKTDDADRDKQSDFSETPYPLIDEVTHKAPETSANGKGVEQANLYIGVSVDQSQQFVFSRGIQIIQ